MKSIFSKLFLCSALALTPVMAFAEEVNNQPEQVQASELRVNGVVIDAKENNMLIEQQNYTPEQTLDAEMQVRNAIQNYYDKQGLIEGLNESKKNKRVYSAAVVVSKPISHPEFPKYKVMAYERAYQKALTNFLGDIAKQFDSETVQKFYHNDGSDAREFPKELSSGTSSFQAIINKIMALTGAKLDNALKEYGVDPSEYNSASADEKKRLLSDSLVTKKIERINKSVSGVVVAQTFFANDSAGEGAIGVIIIYSPNYQSVAEALRMGKKPAVQNKGKSVQEILPLNDSKKMATYMGTRLIFDENGPAIVSFGQWANTSSSKSKATKSRYREAAFKQANLAATNEISRFLNLSFSAEIQAETGEIFETNLIKEGKTGDITEEDISKLVDIINEQSKTKTSSRLQGLQTLKQWIYVTPEGHEFVGVVKMYNFTGIQSAKEAFSKDTRTEGSSSEQTKTYAPNVEQSEDVMDFDTF